MALALCRPAHTNCTVGETINTHNSYVLQFSNLKGSGVRNNDSKCPKTLIAALTGVLELSGKKAHFNFKMPLGSFRNHKKYIFG